MEDYLEIAEASYVGHGVSNFSITASRYPKVFGDGFRGQVYENDAEIIVAFSGTNGNLLTAPISQNVSNLKLSLHIIPNAAGSAYEFVQQAIRAEDEAARSEGRVARPISIVGHSLGGALAQTAGIWSGKPFISLNGPGMADHLRLSRFNIIHPRQLMRTLRTRTSPQDAVGICFTTKGDLIGNYGRHVGDKVKLDRRAEHNHDVDAIRAGLRASALGSNLDQDAHLRKQPSHWNPRFKYIVEKIRLLPLPEKKSASLLVDKDIKPLLTQGSALSFWSKTASTHAMPAATSDISDQAVTTLSSPQPDTGRVVGPGYWGEIGARHAATSKSIDLSNESSVPSPPTRPAKARPRIK
jgi:hypothetical protein